MTSSLGVESVLKQVAVLLAPAGTLPVEGEDAVEKLLDVADCSNGELCFCCSGGQGTRTLNPLRGAAFRMRLLAIRVPSGSLYVYSPSLLWTRCRYN